MRILFHVWYGIGVFVTVLFYLGSKKFDPAFHAEMQTVIHEIVQLVIWKQLSASTLDTIFVLSSLLFFHCCLAYAQK